MIKSVDRAHPVHIYSLKYCLQLHIPQLVAMESKSLLLLLRKLFGIITNFFCIATTNVCQNVVYQRKVHLALMRFLLRCAMLEVNLATNLRSHKSENAKLPSKLSLILNK